MNEMLSICTASYNRAYKLPGLYESLLKQTNKNFEWIIIDDDSKDNTQELVRTWKEKNNGFCIKYYCQEHGGKHRAINRAVEIAKGSFIFIVDSDDKIVENAVELINGWITSCKNNPNIGGVAGLKVSVDGKIWGGNAKISEKYVDATNFERRKYNLMGDKAEVYRKSLLNKFRFPEFEGEYFVTEDTCWLNIAAAGYKIRWFNEPIYIAEYLDDGLSKNGANDFEGHKKNFKGYCFYIAECLDKKPFTDKVIHLKEYNRTCRYLNIGIKERAHNVNISIFRYAVLYWGGIPIGYLIRKIRRY